MAKNCLDKLSGNILQDCTISPVGIKDIYLMHAEDVTVSVSDNVVSNTEFAAGARSYKVEGYKQNIQLTMSIKSLDASAKLNTSVLFKMKPSAKISSILLSNKFYVMAIDASGNGIFLGASSPLECSAMDFDSNSGAGLFTVTLSDPEGSAGNYFLYCTNSVRALVISKSV